MLDMGVCLEPLFGIEFLILFSVWESWPLTNRLKCFVWCCALLVVPSLMLLMNVQCLSMFGGLSISGLWRETRVPDLLNWGSELGAGFVAQNVNRSFVVKMLSPWWHMRNSAANATCHWAFRHTSVVLVCWYILGLGNLDDGSLGPCLDDISRLVGFSAAWHLAAADVCTCCYSTKYLFFVERRRTHSSRP